MTTKRLKLNKMLNQLYKIQKERSKIMRRIFELQRKEVETMRWLVENDWSYIRRGDRVVILNDIQYPQSNDGSDKRALVQYTKKSKTDQLLVFIITENGYNTHRVARNIRKIYQVLKRLQVK